MTNYNKLIYQLKKFPCPFTFFSKLFTRSRILAILTDVNLFQIHQAYYIIKPNSCCGTEQRNPRNISLAYKLTSEFRSQTEIKQVGHFCFKQFHWTDWQVCEWGQRFWSKMKVVWHQQISYDVTRHHNANDITSRHASQQAGQHAGESKSLLTSTGASKIMYYVIIL